MSAQIASKTAASDFSNNPQDLGFVIAAYGWNAYLRDNFIRGNLEFAQKQQIKEMEMECAYYLQQTSEEVALTHAFLKAHATPERVKGVLLEQLLEEAKVLSGILKVQRNDLTLILTRFGKPFNYETASLSMVDAQLWNKLGVPAPEAADWAAHNIAPDMAIKWIKLNNPAVYSAGAAARWTNAGFTSDMIVPWTNLGLTPFAAGKWFRAGFTPEQVKDWLSKGVVLPEMAANVQTPKTIEVDVTKDDEKK